MWIIAVTAPKYSEVVTWWTIWFSICKCLVQGSSIVELKEWLWAVSSVYGVTSAIIFWVLTIINEPVRWGVSPMSRSIHYPWVVVKLYGSSNHDRDDDDQGFGSGPSRVQAAAAAAVGEQESTRAEASFVWQRSTTWEEWAGGIMDHETNSGPFMRLRFLIVIPERQEPGGDKTTFVLKIIIGIREKEKEEILSSHHYVWSSSRGWGQNQ